MPTTPPSQDPRLEEVLFYQIEQAMRQSIRYTHRVFSEAALDLTKDQWLILKKTNDDPEGITPFHLATVLGKEAASMTRMLDIMERKELLVRQPNPSDRRSSLVYPTPLGEQIYRQVLPIVEEIRQQAVAGFSSAEVDQFHQFLKRIRENLV